MPTQQFILEEFEGLRHFPIYRWVWALSSIFLKREEFFLIAVVPAVG
jgi:hypothetical protein